MGKKKITSLRLDEDLVKKAHELGLNVTKICENAIKEAISKLESPKIETNGGFSLLPKKNFTKRKTIHWHMNLYS